MKRGIFLGWPNRIDEATLTGGSWQSGYPLTNLQVRDTSKPALSVTSTPSFSAALGSERSLRAVALINHNLSQAAQWRVQLTGPGGTQDSGWLNVWRMTFDGNLNEYPGFDGFGLWSAHPFATLYLTTDPVVASTVTVEINDPTSVGFIRIGRVFIGGGIQPAIQPTYDGFSEQWDDTGSSIFTADSGAEFFTQRRAARTARFTLPLLDQASEGPDLYEMQRRLGTTGEVLWVPDTQDAVIAQRSGFLGRLRQLSPIEYPFRNTRRAGFEIKEIL